MPSTDDFYQKINEALTKLDQINATLNAGFGALVALGQYANQALWHNSKQNEAIICILEHISRNTCESLNQATIQTSLQTEMRKDLDALADLYATVHADATLERERLQALKMQIEKCCPPPRPEAACRYAACPAPKSLGEPPQAGGPAHGQPSK